MTRVGPSNWLKSGSDKQGEIRQDKAGMPGTSHGSGCIMGTEASPRIHQLPPPPEVLHFIQITFSGKPSMIIPSQTSASLLFCTALLCAPAILSHTAGTLSHSSVLTIRAGSVPFPTKGQEKDQDGAKYLWSH